MILILLYFKLTGASSADLVSLETWSSRPTLLVTRTKSSQPITSLRTLMILTTCDELLSFAFV